jgi:acyl-CoA thioester hydrolase
LIETQMEFAIRPYDVDVAGIVSNIVYVRWLEDLRTELIGEHLPGLGMLERNLTHVVVHTEVDYRAPLRFNDLCTGLMRVARLGRTSLTVGATFRNRKNLLVAEAKQVGVILDAGSGKPVPLPDAVRARLEGGRGA